MVTSGNLFADLPESPQAEEIFETLAGGAAGVRVERIVSTGQTSAEDDWYDQAESEWVAVLRGAARLQIEGEDAERSLGPGDWLRTTAARSAETGLAAAGGCRAGAPSSLPRPRTRYIRPRRRARSAPNSPIRTRMVTPIPEASRPSSPGVAPDRHFAKRKISPVISTLPLL